MQHDNSTADRSDINSSCNSVASAEPHFPELVVKVLDVRLADPFKAYGLNALG
jgi:hypothetical protein